jgi:hypothetical protein
MFMKRAGAGGGWVEKRKTNLQSLVRHEIPIGFGLLTSRQEGTRVEAQVLVATGSFPR